MTSLANSRIFSSTDQERNIHYSIVSESTIRHAYLFGPGNQMHPEDPRMKKLQDDMTKEVQDAGLTMVINQNGRNFFAVKPDLSEEDVDFLKRVDLAFDKITPEENLKLGLLLGYPCKFNMEGIGVHVFLNDIPLSLFSFKCVLTPDTIQKCKNIVQDVRRILTAKMGSVSIEIKTSKGANIEQMGGVKMLRYTMRTRSRKYRGGREEIDPTEAKKYFYKPDGSPYTKAEIDAAANEASNTTSSFERYLVNSIGTYNGKEAGKTASYCNYKDDINALMNDSECIQRGARIKKALQKFANMPPQAYSQFGLSSVANQGLMAVKDTGVNTGKSMFSMFSSNPAPAQTPAPSAPESVPAQEPKKGMFSMFGYGGKRQTKRRSR
jgi:hypothetical protein